MIVLRGRKLKANPQPPVPAEADLWIRRGSDDTDERGVDFEVFKGWLYGHRGLRLFRRYRDVTMRVPLLAAISRPLLTCVALRFVGRRNVVLVDDHGGRERVGSRKLIGLARQFIRDGIGRHQLMLTVDRDLQALRKMGEIRSRLRAGRPVYVRSDMWFGVKSGGSVGHIAGVLNHLREAGLTDPLLVTTDRIPTVMDAIEMCLVHPEGRFFDFAELPTFAFNRTLFNALDRNASGAGFLYQRHSLNSYAPALWARRHDIPFVLEYNGSEVWIERNWGRPLVHEERSALIEQLVLRSADLVVVVSDAIRLELRRRGVLADRIIVNPNGVDTHRYRPDIDGSAVRTRFGLSAGAMVVGFIGTFGPWHGAEILADAFGNVIGRTSIRRDRTRLLMIGDGVRLASTRSRIVAADAERETVFTGRTAQEDGPAYLAATDILVAPHVPNADGTPFFGSPTKLFEYMAMGRAIVASDLDQIGEVLSHEETALLVPPGDPEALADAIQRLIDDPDLRRRLGAAARARAVEAHTWRAHTQRIVDALVERCG